MEAAAARHMRSGARTAVLDEAAAAAPFTAQSASRSDPRADRSYRRKRAIAWTLTVLVVAAVPTLIALLVLFG